MILGLGLDVVEISRVSRTWEKFGSRFARRILHPDELASLERLQGAKVQFLASRFAVKEATVKALGTGFSQGVLPTDIAVRTLPGGRPELVLCNEAVKRFHGLGANRTHLSLTHGRETVAAVVIIENSAV